MKTFFARIAGCAALSACVSLGTTAQAADLGGSCCADLEERIAELEATTARKGNRKVSLAITGQVNHAVLFWDDGHERNAYVVGNKNDQSNFSFSGDAEIAKGIKAGYVITIRLRDNLSDDVSQHSDDGNMGFTLWESYWFVESERFGKLSMGQSSRVSNTAPESDLSETGVAGYAGVQDMGGSFALRFKSGTLSGITLGDVYNHFNGDTANIVRYDTPVIAGFVLSASYGEDDIWDVGARYSGSYNSITLSASIAYTHSTDGNGIDGSGDVSHKSLIGSAAILHKPTGLNALIAAGNRSFDNPLLDLDGNLRTPKDATFVYAKIGWLANLTTLGHTAFYGEYGRFHDYISATGDFTVADAAGNSIGATRISGNTAEVWGIGVVQQIDAAAMQIYLGYRHHDFDFDTVDSAGTRTSGERLHSFQTIVVGSKLAF